MTRVRVTQIVKREPQRILFGGTVLGGPDDGQPVTYHVAGDGGQQIAAAVTSGQHVEVDL